MKKSSLLILTLLSLAGLQSCKSDPNGPSEPIMLTGIYDTSLIDVSGTWRIAAEQGSATLTIRTTGVRFNAGITFNGEFDKRYSQTFVTKRNGRESVGTVHGVNLNTSQVGIAVYSADSLEVTEPCEGEPTPSLYGRYFRVK